MRRIDGLRDDRAGRARGDRALDELMAVVGGAGHGDEQVAGLHFAAVERDSGDVESTVHGAAGSLGDFGRSPENAHAAHSRATTTSSNGSTRWLTPAPMIWPCSWPLPATSTMSPERAILMASAIASRRPAISVAPGAPARISARILAGSSPRGLSSVTITTSDNREATAPISGRLP